MCGYVCVCMHVVARPPQWLSIFIFARVCGVHVCVRVCMCVYGCICIHVQMHVKI